MEPLESATDILAACDRALALAPLDYPPTLPGTPELRGAPAWYPFEHEAWAIGEAVRQVFVRHPRLKKQKDVLAKVLQIATCRNLRRGRQSFVMALGFVAARDQAAELAPLLADPDVDGQVVDTLLKMRAPGFASNVRPLLDSDKAWIRKLVGRYIERYPEDVSY